MVSKTSGAAGVITGCLFASILYMDGVWDLQLGFFIVFSWTIAAWLTVRNHRMLSDERRGWGLLLVGLTVGAAFFGIPELPMSEDLGSELALLLVGAGWATFGVGVEVGQASENRQSSTTVTAD